MSWGMIGAATITTAGGLAASSRGGGNMQAAAPANGMSVPGGPLNVNVGPAMAPPPGTIGIGDLLTSITQAPPQLPGTVGFDPNQKPIGQEGTVGMSDPGGELPEAQKGQMTDLLKTAAQALQNPTIQKLLMGGQDIRTQVAAPMAGGGVNPQVMPGMGLQRGNVGAFLANLRGFG